MSATASAPLCVDLDGTLIHTDLLLESLLQLLKRNPLYILLLPFWLLRGKASLKAQIARRVKVNPSALPFNQELLAWLREQRDSGRALWLCTASNYRLADAVAAHLQIFDGVIASTDDANMSGRAKAGQLCERFGERRFEYCGNHRVDLHIWRRSEGAVVVNGGERLREAASRVAPVRATFPGSRRSVRPYLRALRLHQWAKNLLVFVPLAAAHRVGDVALLASSVQAFFAFGLCASSAYLLNDLLDLEADRQHPRKRLRPFAAGDLSLLAGFAMAPALLVAAALLAWSVSPLFAMVLAAYYSLTLAYSFTLKRLVLIDAIALAGLYTVRIIAGGVAVNVPLSDWLLLFAVFMFYSLALVKRYAELNAMRLKNKLTAAGRGYDVEDLPLLRSLGTSSGAACVLVLALYVSSPAVAALYREPRAIWLLCVLLLYWISRMWLKAHRGQMHDDPVVFALKDRVSLCVGLLGLLAVLVAT